MAAGREKNCDNSPSVCRERFCPTFAVRKYLRELQQSLPLVPPIPPAEMKSLHAAQDYKGMVRLIKQAMNVGVKLRIVWVPEGAAETGATKDAPAWINVPKEMPAYGTGAFEDMRLDLYLRRSFLRQSSHDQIAIVIAHELSHVVLDSIHHPLRGCEKAVDLTAMLLGFRRVYLTGSKKEQKRIVRQLGYLSTYEVIQAHHALSVQQESVFSRIVVHLHRGDIQKMLIALVLLGLVLGSCALLSLTSK